MIGLGRVGEEDDDESSRYLLAASIATRRLLVAAFRLKAFSISRIAAAHAPSSHGKDADMLVSMTGDHLRRHSWHALARAMIFDWLVILIADLRGFSHGLI